MLAVLIAAAWLAAAADEPGAVPEWENPQVNGVNKEPAHSLRWPYADVDAARKGGARGLAVLSLAQWRSGHSTGWANRRIGRWTSISRISTRAAGARFRCRRAGNCRATAFRSIRTSATRFRHDPAAHPARAQPGRLLSHRVRAAGRLAAARDIPRVRRRVFGVLPVGQRAVRRLQRRQQRPGGVQSHPSGEARPEPPGGRGLSLVRRQLSRGPGHVPLQRHLPRRVLGLDAAHPRARRVPALRSRRRLARRHAPGRHKAAQRRGPADERLDGASRTLRR